jgi:hypothetical protein
MLLLTTAAVPIDFQEILDAFTNPVAHPPEHSRLSVGTRFFVPVRDTSSVFSVADPMVPSRPGCFPIGNIKTKSAGVGDKSTRSGALRVAAQHLETQRCGNMYFMTARRP